jgi:hypothetical protein
VIYRPKNWSTDLDAHIAANRELSELIERIRAKCQEAIKDYERNISDGYAAGGATLAATVLQEIGPDPVDQWAHKPASGHFVEGS